MADRFQLILGTHNQKKLRELKILLADLPIEVQSLADCVEPLNVEETGTTFQENARLKATEQARHLNHWVMGEDSGLTVPALNGEPGVYSARYAGEDATDSDNNSKLIQNISSVPPEKRNGYYTSHISLSDPEGNIRIDVQRTCHGRIVLEPRGTAGFGYDPYFELSEYHQTFAELGDSVKSVLSHRARAMREFLEKLKSIIPAALAD